MSIIFIVRVLFATFNYFLEHCTFDNFITSGFVNFHSGVSEKIFGVAATFLKEKFL